MDEIVAALAEEHEELASILRGLDEPDWLRPSRCVGWTVADVVTHLEQSDRMALGSLRGEFAAVVAELTNGLAPASSVDEGAELLVASRRGRSGDEVRATWQATASALQHALAGGDPHQRVEWVAGTLSARTLAATRLAEAWIHTGDVAAAFDIEVMPTDRLRHIARLAWRTLPYAFGRDGRALAGPVAFRLTGPAGDPWDFVPEGEPAMTTVRGNATDLCLVAARRVEPDQTALVAEGPDAAAVLALVRTYA
jgi:uncharacterized protein (TIGR03084 family)